MSIESADLQRFLAPSFLEGLESRSMEELRSARTEVQEAEVAVSYVRRVVQGRLDIVESERRRRTDPGAGDGGPVHAPDDHSSDHGSIVEDLPGILADPGHSGRGAGPGRLPMHMDPGEHADDLVAGVDREVDPNKLTELDSLSQSELDVVTDSLRDIERQLSDQRHSLHGLLDLLQAEMVRRYRSGEANVDNLLS